MLLLFSLCFTEMVIKLWGRLHCSRKMVDVISGDFQIQPMYFLKVVFWRNTSNGGLNIRGNWMEYKYLKQKLSVDELIFSPGLKCMKIQIALLQCVCFLHLIGFLSGLKKLQSLQLASLTFKNSKQCSLLLAELSHTMCL